MLRQAGRDDPIERRRRQRLARRDWRRVVFQNRRRELGLGIADECTNAGDHLVEHGAECKDVAAARPCASPRSCSGAMYGTVPTTGLPRS